MIRLLGLTILLLMASCKGDTSTSNPEDKPATTTTPKKTFASDGHQVNSGSQTEDGSYTYNIPAPEEAWTKEEVEKALGLDPGAVHNLKANGTSESRSRSCFYRISDPEKSNAAIVLQISGNPMPDEFPDWASYYIANVKTDGEKSLKDPDVTLKYSEFPFGVSGAGNAELGKYYWRDKNDLVYMLAFNVDQSEKEIEKAAYELVGYLAERNDQ